MRRSNWGGLAASAVQLLAGHPGLARLRAAACNTTRPCMHPSTSAAQAAAGLAWAAHERRRSAQHPHAPGDAAPYLDLRGRGPADHRLLVRLPVLEHRQHLVVGQQAQVLLHAAGGRFGNSTRRRRAATATQVEQRRLGDGRAAFPRIAADPVIGIVQLAATEPWSMPLGLTSSYTSEGGPAAPQASGTSC